MYSAAVAAPAYAAVRANGATIRRVVLLGPGHRVAVRGIAAPTAAFFRTPLGDVPLDRAAIDGIADVGSVMERRAAFAPGMVTALSRVYPARRQALAAVSALALLVPANVALFGVHDSPGWVDGPLRRRWELP